MKITLDIDTSVKDVQKQFSDLFPFLQIQFYRMRPDVKSVKVIENEKLKYLVRHYGGAVLKFSEETTVTDLQRVFEDLGLYVQVFRKFGSFWIATSLTDDWTLDRQNQEARLLCTPAETQVPGMLKVKTGK
jgi:hypothetical protein